MQIYLHKRFLHRLQGATAAVDAERDRSVFVSRYPSDERVLFPAFRRSSLGVCRSCEAVRS